MERSTSRRMWKRLEAYHAVVYFAPESKAAYEAAGLRGGWMGYFAGRAAPLGQVPAEVVTALFYNFAPAMVRRALPDAWSFSTPERVLAARLRFVHEALRRLLGDRALTPALAEAARIASAAAERCQPAGRPLFAANAAQPWPEDPHLRLWHAATMLREHRGDGHVAALVAAGLDGCEAHLTMVGTGAVPADALRPYRGWSDEEWTDAGSRLRDRGILHPDGTLTAAGAELRRWVEERTDDLALSPWQSLGEAETSRLYELMEEPVELVLGGGDVPFPNPMGLPDPRV
jgi:hypothetical protein